QDRTGGIEQHLGEPHDVESPRLGRVDRVGDLAKCVGRAVAAPDLLDEDAEVHEVRRVYHYSSLPGTMPFGNRSMYAQISRGRVSQMRSRWRTMCSSARRSCRMRYGRPMTNGCSEIGHTSGWR